MSAINIKLNFENPNVELPCVFIDHYMTVCTPVYALIYIYTLRQCIKGTAAISSQDIGRVFQILETDVFNAWRYWENEGLIQLDTRDGGMSITFLSMREPVKKPEAYIDEQFTQESLLQEPLSSTPETATLQATAVVKPFAPAGRPQYTVEELSIYRQQSRDIERLFAHAEQLLGKLLTYHDMNVMFGFYDWLRLPVDVILYLLSYCADHDRRDLRYIEKVAIDWAENGIDDVEKALEYVQTFDRDYRDILRVMGQSTGIPTPSQRKYIHKWLHEYAMSPALALEACDRAAAQIGRPKFTYVDKIMEDWYKKGIHKLEDVQADAEDFARKKAEAVRIDIKPKPVKTNRFVNFKQRERDYAQLEKMEREYLVQSLKG